MRKTLYLHIGKHKTGTTSIQNYLAENSDLFSDRGWHICTNIRTMAGDVGRSTNCWDIAHLLLREDLETPIRLRGHDTRRSRDQKWRAAREVNTRLSEIASPNLVISAEAFSWARTIEERELADVMFEGVWVVPIVCVRDPAAWMSSWRRQTQNFHDRFSIDRVRDSIVDFSADSWLVDDRAINDFWGPQTVSISYEQVTQLDQSVIPSFLRAVGLEPEKCPPWDKHWANQTRLAGPWRTRLARLKKR